MYDKQWRNLLAELKYHSYEVNGQYCMRIYSISGVVLITVLRNPSYNASLGIASNREITVVYLLRRKIFSFSQTLNDQRLALGSLIDIPNVICVLLAHATA